MGLLTSVFPSLEAKRRWNLPEPEGFVVRVDPSVPFGELLREAALPLREPHWKIDRPGRPFADIYAAKDGKPYERRFELLQLCTDIAGSDIKVMAGLVMAGDMDGYRAASDALDERRRRNKERMSVDVDDALVATAERGYRPADAHELLHFVMQHSYKDRPHHDITALGAVYRENDNAFALSLYDRPYQREFRLMFQRVKGSGYWSAWLPHHRFLSTRVDQ